MSFLSLFRNLAVLGALNVTTLGVGGGTYLLGSYMIELAEDHEARMVCDSLIFSFVNQTFEGEFVM